MFLKNGDYIKDGAINFLSTIKTVKGGRRWNANMTKEIVDPDTYAINVKLESLDMTLEYSEKADAIEDYSTLRKNLELTI
ncbi:MAG: hypothetical protein U9Q62_01320 [Campylobacterota bacterium]|nr:hypothetical protein [Campylobacterota bacterium]